MLAGISQRSVGYRDQTNFADICHDNLCRISPTLTDMYHKDVQEMCRTIHQLFSTASTVHQITIFNAFCVINQRQYSTSTHNFDNSTSNHNFVSSLNLLDVLERLRQRLFGGLLLGPGIIGADRFRAQALCDANFLDRDS